jgi:hypothetical protein
MLSVPKLDDLGYEKMLTQARSRIPMLTGEWTDLNDHDPGITTLQTLAWLTDMLNYYIDATGEKHRLKYLRLLGLEPKRSAARCFVALSSETKEIAVYRGARLAAGDMVFETAGSYTGVSNGPCALFMEIDGLFTDLTPIAGVDGGYAALFGGKTSEGQAIYIGFRRELSGELRFWADTPIHPARNPFTDDFKLSQLIWEYFDGGEWREAALIRDDTCAFLKGGYISLDLNGKSKPLKGHASLPAAHYLRARLLINGYDAPPKIGRLYMNTVEVVQTETLAQTLEIEFDGKSAIEIDYHIREDDVISVAVEDGDGYALWFENVLDGNSLCEVVPGSKPWLRVVRFDEKRFGAAPVLGQKILITITRAALYEKLRLGITKGFAQERMEIDIENLYELRLALVGEKNRHLQIWDVCGEISGQACDAAVFSLDYEKGEVIFGDSISGRQPEAGLTVRAITAKTSMLGGGNVRAGQLERFSDKVYDGLSAYNPETAAGGCEPKTSEELELEIENMVYKTNRAVNTRDYIEIVTATPGLMIDCVNVISSGEYAKYYGGTPFPNTVLLAVKPRCEYEPRPELSEPYRRRIRENIEKYRLLTTDVRILPAKYAYIEAEGRIILSENTLSAQEQVREALRGLIDFTHTGGFGASVIYGRVFSRLEMLPSVSKVSRLSFACAGEGARKNGQGDIIVFPDALAWLGNISIEFI